MTLKKTMKQTLACLLAAGTLVSLTACGGEKDDIIDEAVDTVIDDQSQKVEPDYDYDYYDYEESVMTEPEVVLTDDELPYDQRSYYHNSAHFESIYLDYSYSDFETTDYVAEDDTVTHTAYIGQELPDNFSICGAEFDEDGRFYVDDCSDYVVIPEDLKGDIIGAYYSSFSGNIVTYSFDQDGTLYLNVFDPNGKRDFPYGYNDVVYVKYGDDDIVVDKFEAVSFEQKVSGNMSYMCFFFAADDMIFFGDINSSFRNEFWGTHVQVSLDDIVADSYMLACSPLFTQDGDENTLYYRHRYGGSEPLKMEMPEGYTVDDIKDIFFFEDAVVVFNDNAVYSGKVTDIRTTLQLHEELTDHMQNGHVLHMYSDAHDVNVDMINGCRYNVNPSGKTNSYW